MFKFKLEEYSFILKLYRVCRVPLASSLGVRQGYADPTNICALFWVIAGGMLVTVLATLMALFVAAVALVVIFGGGFIFLSWLIHLFQGDQKAFFTMIAVLLGLLAIAVFVVVVVLLIAGLRALASRISFRRKPKQQRPRTPARVRTPRPERKPSTTWLAVREAYRSFKERTCILVEVVPAD